MMAALSIDQGSIATSCGKACSSEPSARRNPPELGDPEQSAPRRHEREARGTVSIGWGGITRFGSWGRNRSTLR